MLNYHSTVVLTAPISIKHKDDYVRLWQPSPSRAGDKLIAICCNITREEWLKDTARLIVE